MKKRLAAVFAAALSLCLAGCSSGKVSDTADKDLEPEIHIFDKPKPRRTQEPEKTEPEYVFGSVRDGVYLNEQMKLWYRFEDAGLHEDREAFSDPETYREYVFGSYVYDAEAAEKDLASGGSVTELFCRNYTGETMEDTDVLVNVTIQAAESSEEAAVLADRRIAETLEKMGSEEGNWDYYLDGEGSRITLPLGSRFMEGAELTYHYYDETAKVLDRMYYLNAGKYVYSVNVEVMSGSDSNVTFEELREKADEVCAQFFPL